MRYGLSISEGCYQRIQVVYDRLSNWYVIMPSVEQMLKHHHFKKRSVTENQRSQGGSCPSLRHPQAAAGGAAQGHASPGNATTVRPWLLILFRGLLPFSCRPPGKTQDSHETPGCVGRFQTRTGVFIPFSSNCYARKTPSFYFAKALAMANIYSILKSYSPALPEGRRTD